MSRHIIHIDKSKRHTDIRDEVHNLVLSNFVIEDNTHILDIGCGLGEFLEGVKNPYVHKIGIDTDEKCVEISKQFVSDADFRIADGCNLPFADESFDIVAALGVVEHVDNPTTLIKESFRVCKVGGQGVFMTPNIGRPQRFLLAMAKKDRWERSGHKQGWDYHLFKRCLENNGWSVEKMKTRFVDCPFYKYLPETVAKFLSYKILLKLFPRIGSELYAFCRRLER